MIGKKAITPDGREWLIMADMGDDYFECQSLSTGHRTIWHKQLLAVEVDGFFDFKIKQS